MAEILDYFDQINIDVAKRKYYNINKVNSVLEELRALAVDLVDENERQRHELMQLRSELGQKTANRMQSEELLTSMQSLYRETLSKAHSRADGIVQEAEAHCEKLQQDVTVQRENAEKQLKECREYDEKLAHLALSRIELDLDDGVKVNYRKIQTANDGKFYEVLADSKNKQFAQSNR